MIILKLLLLIASILLQGGFVHAGDSTLQLTEADKKNWLVCIKKVKMKPPCCGACRIITNDEAKSIWNYLTRTTENHKSEKDFEAWLAHKKRLLEEFKKLSPERYRVLYGKES